MAIPQPCFGEWPPRGHRIRLQSTGQLFLTGGLAFDPTSIFLPCSFRGTLTGNQVQGTFDEAPCGGTGTFLLTKQ